MKAGLPLVVLLAACSEAAVPAEGGDGDGVLPVAAIWEQAYPVGDTLWNVVLEGAFAGETGDVRVYGGTDEAVAHALAEQGCREAGRSFDASIAARLPDVGNGAQAPFVYDDACLA